MRPAGVVDLDPKEEWSLRIVAEPSDSAGHDLGAGASRNRRPGIAWDGRAKAGVICLEASVEALCQAVYGIEVNGADKSSRAIALRLKQFRKGRKRRSQRTSNFAQASALRINASKDRGMRYDGAGRLGIGMFKDNALG